MRDLPGTPGRVELRALQRREVGQPLQVLLRSYAALSTIEWSLVLKEGYVPLMSNAGLDRKLIIPSLMKRIIALSVKLVS
jgi:hypothetical protein